MTTPFISSADLSGYLGQDVTTEQLTVVALDSACEIVRAYLQQRLNYVADEAILLDGNGRAGLLLPELPVIEVSAVSLDGTVITDFTCARNGILYRDDLGAWTWGRQNVAVTYSHGYAVAESLVEHDPSDATPLPDRMPSDIRSVALSIAKRVFEAGSIASGGVTGETIGGYSYTLNPGAAGEAGALLEGEKQILGLHAERRVA